MHWSSTHRWVDPGPERCCCPPYREPDADAEEEATPWKEQENWESHQIKAASMKTGAKDRAAKQSQYDFVFDDAIGFVQDQMLAGGCLCCGAIPVMPQQLVLLACRPP